MNLILTVLLNLSILPLLCKDLHNKGKICKCVYDNLLSNNKNALYDKLKRIGIDETSYKKGYKYITVIVNHDTSSLVWAHEGKGEDVLKLFFAQLTPNQRNCIEVVTADGTRWIKKVVMQIHIYLKIENSKKIFVKSLNSNMLK